MGYLRGLLTLLLLIPLLLSTGVLAVNVLDADLSELPETKAWFSVDTSIYTLKVPGEYIGEPYDYPFAGWYSDAAAISPDGSTYVTAWMRTEAYQRNEEVYIGVYKPLDLDGLSDGAESLSMMVKRVYYRYNIPRIDSIAAGSDWFIVTWTEYWDSDYLYDVKAVAYDYEGNHLWTKPIAYQQGSYEEYSKACYIESEDKFMIFWYTSNGEKIEARSVDRSGYRGSILTVSYTDLYYKKADVMTCIGGYESALIAYRVWDSNEYRPDLKIAIVTTSSVIVNDVTVYDDPNEEEFPGVKGAYISVDSSDYFILPFVSGSSVGYAVIDGDGNVVTTEIVGEGKHPYAIALSDRVMMAWATSDSIVIANIDPGTWDYSTVSITPLTEPNHPLLTYSLTDGKVITVWTAVNVDEDVYYAIIDPGVSPSDQPSVIEQGVLISWSGDQEAHGLVSSSVNQWLVVFKDYSDGEEDLKALIVLPDSEYVGDEGIKLFFLPRDGEAYLDFIVNDLLENAQNEILAAVAYWRGTQIPNKLVEKKAAGLDVKVIMDDSAGNSDARSILEGGGVEVIDDDNTDYSMHDKFVVVDSSRVLAATVNFIEDDFTKNNNTAIYIESKALAYFFKGEFNHMWAGNFHTDKYEDHSFLTFINYQGRVITIEGYFCPQDYGDKNRVANVIASYISSSTSNVRLAHYIFTTGWAVQPIISAIEYAKSNGVDVKAVFDHWMNLDTNGRAAYELLDAGADVAFSLHKYSLHAKIFSMDDTVAVIGSLNPTTTGVTKNDEYVLIIRDPDTTNGIAKQVADYITALFNKYYSTTWTATYPVINEVMFYPDTSGTPTYEWVEIYNPTNEDIDLTLYRIGDIDNVFSDDEGLYAFPEGAVLPANSYIIVAYDASAFYEVYDFKPNYEIVDSDPTVPNMVKVLTDKFTGDWNLDDSGDEVLLIKASPYDPEFLIVVDAAWYGTSTYLSNPVDVGGISEGWSIERQEAGLDAPYAGTVFLLNQNPTPIPEEYVALVVLITVAAVIITLVLKREFKA